MGSDNEKGKVVELEAGVKHDHKHNNFFRQLGIVGLFFGVIVVTFFLLDSRSTNNALQFLAQLNSRSLVRDDDSLHANCLSSSSSKGTTTTLKDVLENAATWDKNIIITFLNEAWAAPGSIFDLFLESFRVGNQIENLVRHLVVVAVDQTAYKRCLEIHQHCYALSKPNETWDSSGEEAYYGTQDFLEMMWKRIDFLRSVLELGYNFIFTDTDIMWFNNPFPRLYLDADFQISCDVFKGDPSDMSNSPNSGFNYVKSNHRTIEFYKFWYNSRTIYPGKNDQNVFEKVMLYPLVNEMGMKIKFLDTKYFAGFCSPSRDLDEVCTMHANCCCGLQNKIFDLTILLEDWRRYLSLKANGSASQLQSPWTVPQKCINSYHPPEAPKKKTSPPASNN